MAISQKVSKPALSPEWQNAITVCDSATDAAGTSGFTSCIAGEAGAISLADGHYNGQMAVIYAADANTYTVTPDNILGNSSATALVSKSCGIFIWYDDGTTSGWACIKGGAGS